MAKNFKMGTSGRYSWNQPLRNIWERVSGQEAKYEQDIIATEGTPEEKDRVRRASELRLANLKYGDNITGMFMKNPFANFLKDNVRGAQIEGEQNFQYQLTPPMSQEQSPFNINFQLPQFTEMPLSQAAQQFSPYSAAGESISDTDYWRSRNDIPLYRKGGVVMHDKINIEKGELEVNPEDMSIVREFMAPKHPEGKGKNPKGDRYVQKGNAIIPADKAMEFKKGDAKAKQKILDSLPKHTKNGKAEGGVNASGNYMDTIPTGQNPDMIYYPEDYQQGNTTNVNVQNAGGTTQNAGSSYFNPVGMGIGINQWIRAGKALKELNKQPLPTLTDYQTLVELRGAYSRAEDLAKQGYTTAETNAFKQNLAQNRTAAYRKATDMSGGSLSSAIGGVLNAQNVGAYNQFAAQDAALKRRNIAYADSLARALQSQQNLQTQGIREYERLLFARRQQAEANLALARSQGMQNVAGSINISGRDIGSLVSLLK